MQPAVSKILELPENQEVAVVGTVYKEMQLKPSILSEYNKVRHHTRFTSISLLTVPMESAKARHSLELRPVTQPTDLSLDVSLPCEARPEHGASCCAAIILQDRGIETLTGHTSFVSDDDSLVLEDESARMALRGPGIAAGPLVTGVVAAVRGVSSANGDFQVKVSSSSYSMPQGGCLEEVR